MNIVFNLENVSQTDTDIGDINEGKTKEFYINLINNTNYPIVDLALSCKELKFFGVPSMIGAHEEKSIKVSYTAPTTVVAPISLNVSVIGVFRIG